jgi:hypothetical protein
MLVNIFRFLMLLFLFIVMIAKSKRHRTILRECAYLYRNEYVKNHNIGFNYRDMDLFAL